MASTSTAHDIFGANVAPVFTATNVTAEKTIFDTMERIRTGVASPYTALSVLSGVEVSAQDVSTVPTKVRRVYTVVVDLNTGTETVDV